MRKTTVNVPLSEIPQGSKIKAEVMDGTGKSRIEMLTFHHIDGMYSYITTESGDAVHLYALTPMVNRGEYYEIADTVED